MCQVFEHQTGGVQTHETLVGSDSVRCLMASGGLDPVELAPESPSQAFELAVESVGTPASCGVDTRGNWLL